MQVLLLTKEKCVEIGDYGGHSETNIVQGKTDFYHILYFAKPLGRIRKKAIETKLYIPKYGKVGVNTPIWDFPFQGVNVILGIVDESYETEEGQYILKEFKAIRNAQDIFDLLKKEKKE